jgi:oxygen-independent coproporphyrinogen-3 oxidase
VEYVRAAGFSSYNLDLMHGLPGQDSNAALADLRTAIACAPPHLSWYQLTIEPNTVFYKQPPILPVEDELADIQQRGEALLAAAGYQQYEVSAYSLRAQQCRHNLNYWSFGDYLGIGAGAHGKVSFPDGRIERYAKRRQPTDYLAAAAGGFTASRHRLEMADVAGEFMLNALRLNKGFSLAQFTARTGLDVDRVSTVLEQFHQQGLLECNGDRVKTTALGRRFLDNVVAGFFPEP